MKSRIAVNALNNAVARRGDVAECIVHTDRGSQFRSHKHIRTLNRHGMVILSMGRIGAAGDNAAMESFFGSIAEQRSGQGQLDHPRGTTHRDGHLDRTYLPPTSQARRPLPIDPCSIRDQDYYTGHSGCLPEHVT